jgi:hypothetical protein
MGTSLITTPKSFAGLVIGGGFTTSLVLKCSALEPECGRNFMTTAVPILAGGGRLDSCEA